MNNNDISTDYIIEYIVPFCLIPALFWFFWSFYDFLIQMVYLKKDRKYAKKLAVNTCIILTFFQFLHQKFASWEMFFYSLAATLFAWAFSGIFLLIGRIEEKWKTPEQRELENKDPQSRKEVWEKAIKSLLRGVQRYIREK